MKIRLWFSFAVLCLSCTAIAAPGAFDARTDVREFIDDMVGRHGFVADELEFLFSRARSSKATLRAITPRETPRARSWKTYRARFVNDRHFARAGTGSIARSYTLGSVSAPSTL